MNSLSLFGSVALSIACWYLGQTVALKPITDNT